MRTWSVKGTLLPAAALVLATALTACGGGGGEIPLASLAAKQLTIVEGPISGFGSTIVNGVRFDDSKARVVDEDDQVRSLADLRLGTMVKVEGTGDDDAGTGSATKVTLIPSLLGKVEAVNASAGTLVVLGQTVRVDASTAFDGVAGLSALAVNDAIRVNGLVVADGSFAATLIEKLRGPIMSFEVRGIVDIVDHVNHTFAIGALTVDYSSAVLKPDGAEPFGGALVKLRSRQGPVAGVLFASSVKVHTPRSDYTTTGAVKLKGILDVAPDETGNTTVSGVPVALSGASLEGSGNLVAGQRVEIKGVLVDGVIQVTTVEFEGARASRIGGANELYGVIANFASPNVFNVNGVTVDASQASFDNGTLAMLANDVYVEIKGNLRTGAGGTVLVATRVEFKQLPRFEHSGDDGRASHDFYGVIQNFVSLSNFTLNGRLVDGSGAKIEDGSASDLHNGVYAEIKGAIDGDKLIASVIEIKGLRGSLDPAPVPPPVGDAANGATLYATSCAGCHGADPTANNKDVLDGANNGAKIARLIAENEGGMGVLTGLNTEQIQDIAAYLGAPATTPTAATPPAPPPTDIRVVDAASGQRLYASNCTSCHGTDPAENQNKILSGANDDVKIANAIAGNKGGMGMLVGVLRAADLKDIAAYLGTVAATPPVVVEPPPVVVEPPPVVVEPPPVVVEPPPVVVEPPPPPGPSAANGKLLYVASCTGCHGADPAENRNNILAGANSYTTIASAISNIGGMKSYSFLTTAELKDIAAYLVGPTY